ncbi:structural maintenance of chromosomes protein 2 [Leptidea sinapis]|uniref:structural maintenance of chromosomes protein 2 n=1 Tax=Leptidea sinapis TaxID=189913 RepID=UPI0021435ABF|nr:structural maintenance of chromosomes protein 2 [Leptidea sinapis]XP_050673160.1 structural maintenance of chromosomes protein 2 [Leptidea sinapis]
MFIKSIVLDGFKSYGNRVEVTGFDPEFNAITGLNGTGKSNILDSICFVLGITNLSNVRAGSLQELIYKHGQAGITKATVAITFDNRKKTQSPIGYENHDEITVTRQVVMGGKNKYLINGINVQNKRVTDLFCSIQLNVNNPHFLIMQGRITKVLNMKPPEILSMVEEAAGTRMYEAKKQAAQKTIEKKDAKLRELNDIIKEDIAPKLQKLQDERAQFQEYQKVVREVENLSRLHVAWRYVSAEKNVKEAHNKVKEVELDIKEKIECINSNKRQAKEIDTEITEMNRRVDEEAGNVLKSLEADLAQAELAESSANAAQKVAKDNLAASEGRGRLLQRAMDDDSGALRDKREQLQQATATFDGLRTASEASEARLAAAQARFLAISSGRDGDDHSLQDRLIEARQEASEASTRISQSTMEKKHAEKRLMELEKEFNSSSAQYQRDLDTISEQQARCEQLQGEVERAGSAATALAEARERHRALTGAVRSKRDAAERLAVALQRCDFTYSPPEPDFNAARVAGTVCRLIDVVDPKYCTALETAAGGRLYNVVVDTEITSKLLLQRGKLQSRTTIIPLNKISSRPIDQQTLRAAQEIGGGADKVQLALELVRFPQSVRPALQWVFGNTLVCTDLEVAKRVTFHPRVRCRCVTLDGDVLDPAGTLSGGARAKGGSVLLQLSQLKQLEQELQQLDRELAQSSAQLATVQQAHEQYTALKHKFEMSSHALTVARERVAGTAHAQLHQEIQALREQVSQLTAAVEEDKRKQEETSARARDLEAKVKDIKGHREREFKKAESELKNAKAEAEHHKKEWELKEQDFETLRLEVQELESGVETTSRQLRELTDASGELRIALRAASEQHDRAKEEMKTLQSKIKKQRADIANRNTDIARLLAKKEQLLKQNNEHELKIKELEYKIKELKTEAVECEKRIKSLEHEHGWISSERQFFGAAGGVFDFEARPHQVTSQRLAQLTERRDRLARGVNARAHTLLGSEEQQYQDVLRKKKIVEADRAKLVQVMGELDEKKRRTLVTACEQVNRDFGSIFSTLLPGAEAELRPPPGLTVLDGLEVRVGFNGTWKESLGELSGGQRSLVALSLVLSMLLFKPAPLYILDEVDAALDLSHTQNIGIMLKEHFRHSQFIIVSLKDGMFNNANVLFRTRFVDGMSAVQRTVNVRR